VRLTVGTDNDEKQLEHVAQTLPAVIERLRALSPV
jgi:cysteine sulfinate desulfinase/cysteine desulfurase-like protein